MGVVIQQSNKQQCFTDEINGRGYIAVQQTAVCRWEDVWAWLYSSRTNSSVSVMWRMFVVIQQSNKQQCFTDEINGRGYTAVQQTAVCHWWDKSAWLYSSPTNGSVSLMRRMVVVIQQSNKQQCVADVINGRGYIAVEQTAACHWWDEWVWLYSSRTNSSVSLWDEWAWLYSSPTNSSVSLVRGMGVVI